MVRHPMTVSATPARYDLAPPELDEQGESVRAWLSTPAQHTGDDARQGAA